MIMENYSVYIHRTPNGMNYVGISTNPIKRWEGLNYKGTSLQKYIDEFGFNGLEHFIIASGLTREQAQEIENNLILMYQSNNTFIIERRSGLVSNAIKEYQKEYYQKRKDRWEKSYQKTEWKIYNRVNAFNRRHKDKMVETALEAKRKYLESGYIPTYIKNDDIIK